jgi:hypothetical protein
VSEVFVASPQPIGAVPSPLTDGAAAAEAQRAARASLRAQIAHLDRELSVALVEVFAMRGRAPDGPAPAPGATRPRLLDLGELERVRDGLAHRLSVARDGIAAQREAQGRARARLEQLRLDPGHHRFQRVSLRELGEPGCGVYHVAPRLGLIGMLMDWWEVKLSSGCPLCMRPPLTRRYRITPTRCAPC